MIALPLVILKDRITQLMSHFLPCLRAKGLPPEPPGEEVMLYGGRGGPGAIGSTSQDPECFRKDDLSIFLTSNSSSSSESELLSSELSFSDIIERSCSSFSCSNTSCPFASLSPLECNSS
ncbi:hypothetical protein NN561_014007 [Cricetulus griseus]